MKNATNILVGVLGAAAAGVVIGMILAPKKGDDLREDIKNSTHDFTNKLSDLMSRGKEKYDELRSLIGEKGNDVNQSTKELVAEADHAYREFTSKAESAYKGFSHDVSKAIKNAKA